jgi:heme exporter protein A
MESSSDKMNPFKLTAANLTKSFNNRVIFKNISFSLSPGSSLAITGANGSGKSTLTKIIAGLMSPTAGHINCTIQNTNIKKEEYKYFVGFVSPYLNLYDELTALENVRMLTNMRVVKKPTDEKIDSVLEFVGLWNLRNDPVSIFSSGMKQRLKYAFAIVHEPHFLVLDEPTSNLDAEGIGLIRRIIKKQKEHGTVIIATNDNKEVKWCEKELQLVIK